MLPADFFTTRFVWANNPVGNDNSFFLGVHVAVPTYAAYNHPAGASSQIDWTAMPMFFTEDGPSSAASRQQPPGPGDDPGSSLPTSARPAPAATTPTSMAHVSSSRWISSPTRPGPRPGYGITTFQTGVYQTIVDTVQR